MTRRRCTRSGSSSRSAARWLPLSHRVWESAGCAVWLVAVVAWVMPPDATVTRHVTVESPTSWVFEQVTVSVSSVASVTALFE